MPKQGTARKQKTNRTRISEEGLEILGCRTIMPVAASLRRLPTPRPFTPTLRTGSLRPRTEETKCVRRSFCRLFDWSPVFLGSVRLLQAIVLHPKNTDWIKDVFMMTSLLRGWKPVKSWIKISCRNKSEWKERRYCLLSRRHRHRCLNRRTVHRQKEDTYFRPCSSCLCNYLDPKDIFIWKTKKVNCFFSCAPWKLFREFIGGRGRMVPQVSVPDQNQSELELERFQESL